MNHHTTIAFTSILALLTVSITARDAAAEATIDYAVKAGDTCRSIAKAELHDVARTGELHRLNPQLGPKLPHVLVPGQILRLPAPRPDAELASSHGEVTARGPAQPAWHPARVGDDFFRAWRVSSGDRSAAEVRFTAASTVALRENTIVVIYGAEGTTAAPRPRQAVLESGALRVRLSELAGGPASEQVTISTPSAEAAVTRGNVLVTVEQGGTTTVANHGGAPTLVKSHRRRAKPVSVAENFGSMVAPGQDPTPPRPLPPSPAWVAEAPLRFIAVNGSTADLSIGWQPVTQAAHYRIDISSDPDGRALVQQLVVDASITRFEAKSSPLGTLYLTVSTIDGDRFESRPSPRAALVVAALAVSTGSGTPTADAHALTVGATIVAPDGMRCTVNDSTPTAAVTVRAPGTLTLRCVDAAGRPAAPATLVVAPFTVSIAAPDVLVRGARATVTLAGDAALLGVVTFDASPGVELGAAIHAPGGRLEIPLLALAGGKATSAVVRVMLPVGASESGLAAIEVARATIQLAAPPVAVTARSVAATSAWSLGILTTARRDGYGGGIRGAFALRRFAILAADVDLVEIDPATTHARAALELAVDPLGPLSLRVRPVLAIGVAYDLQTTTVEPRLRAGLHLAATRSLAAEISLVHVNDDRNELRVEFARRF